MHVSIGLHQSTSKRAGPKCATVVDALHLIPPKRRTAVPVATPISTGDPRLCGNRFLVGPIVSGAMTN